MVTNELTKLIFIYKSNVEANFTHKSYIFKMKPQSISWRQESPSTISQVTQ